MSVGCRPFIGMPHATGGGAGRNARPTAAAAAGEGITVTPRCTPACATIDADQRDGSQMPLLSRILFDRHAYSELELSQWKMNLLCLTRDGRTLFIATHGERIIAMNLDAQGRPVREAERIEAEMERAAAAAAATEGEVQLLESESEGATADQTKQNLSEPSATTASSSNNAAAGTSVPVPPASHRPRSLDHPYLWLSIPPLTSSHDDDDDPPHPFRRSREINTLRLVDYDGATLLAATTMDGRVVLWDTDHLTQPPIVRQCTREGHQDNSAWSVASTPNRYDGTSPSPPIIAVGTNAHCAFLWELEKDSSAASSNLTSPASPPSAASCPIVGVGHNVPSVDISSCGRFLALACIDGHTRIAQIDSNTQDGETTTTKFISERAISSQWGWTVRWIRPDSIQRIDHLTLSSVQAHEEHLSPVAPASPTPAPRPAPQADAFLTHMVDQLVTQLIAAGRIPGELTGVQLEYIRRRLREQLRRAQNREHGQEDEWDEDDEEDDEEEEQDADHAADEPSDDEDESDVESDASDGSGGISDDTNSTPGLADDSSALSADVDVDAAIPHDEMGWEAGFEPTEQHGSTSPSITPTTPPPGPAESIEPTPASHTRAHPGQPHSHDAHAGAHSPDTHTLGTPAEATQHNARKKRSRKELPSDLLIYTSKTNLYLVDAKLNVLCSLPRACRSTLTIHRSLDRLVFVEWLSGLSTLLLGSSAGDRLLILRLRRYACGGYRFECDGTIPPSQSTPTRVPIQGVTVARVNNEPTHRNQIPIQRRIERIRQHDHHKPTHGRPEDTAALPIEFDPYLDSVPPPSLSPPSFDSHAASLARHLVRYRVYIVWSNHSVGGYELTRQMDATEIEQI